jgi:hypothetical protein
MNPSGPRPAHVRVAPAPANSVCSAAGASQFNPRGQSSTRDCGAFGYTKFTPDRSGMALRAMQYELLFIFQKDIRAAIELKSRRPRAIISDATVGALEGSPWKRADSVRAE